MSELFSEESPFYQVFMRDDQRCVYCGINMMESFDAFAQIQIDHLKPRKNGGDDSIDNMVTSCAVCNALKGSFDALPEVSLDAENRSIFLEESKKYIAGKREGQIDNSYFRDYRYWKDQLGK